MSTKAERPSVDTAAAGTTLSSAPSDGEHLRGEIRALTGLRAIAAVWVVFFHFRFTPGDAYTPYWQWLRPVVISGAYGVDLFYVLSGFVITLTYLDRMGSGPFGGGARRWGRTTVSFLWNRICRIWPVYATVTVLFFGWLLYKATRVTDGFVAYQTVQPVRDLPHLLEQLAMVQLWYRPFFDGASFVGPAWSISAEWSAYVAFPVVVLLIWRLRRLPAVVTGPLAVVAVTPLAWLTYSTGSSVHPWAWSLRIAGGFVAGSLVCLAVRRIRRTPQVARVASVVSVLAIVEIGAVLWWADWRGQGAEEYAGVAVVMFPVLVGALALADRGPAQFLSADWAVHGGRISYSLYLVHVPILEIFWTCMGWYPSIAPGTGLGTFLIPQLFLLILVVAHLMYRFVEEPARLRLRRHDPGKWGTRNQHEAVVNAAGSPPVDRADATAATPAARPGRVASPGSTSRSGSTPGAADDAARVAP